MLNQRILFLVVLLIWNLSILTLEHPNRVSIDQNPACRLIPDSRNPLPGIMRFGFTGSKEECLSQCSKLYPSQTITTNYAAPQNTQNAIIAGKCECCLDTPILNSMVVAAKLDKKPAAHVNRTKPVSHADFLPRIPKKDDGKKPKEKKKKPEGKVHVPLKPLRPRTANKHPPANADSRKSPRSTILPSMKPELVVQKPEDRPATPVYYPPTRRYPDEELPKDIEAKKNGPRQ